MKNTQETFFSLFHSVYEIERGKIDPVNTGNQQDDDEINGKTVPVFLRGIRIPRIQRDYAQGREGKKVTEIRKEFLHDLHEAVAKRQACSLNFIYGKLYSPKRIHGEEKYSAELLPLDGQQRLTTLFLLHWYASRIADADPAQTAVLNGFSYYTRFTSEDFCNFLKDIKTLRPDENEAGWLEENTPGWSPEQSLLPLADKAVSTFLKNKCNFADSWKKDETVAGMLNMLDAIHQKFHDIPDLWDRLVCDECTIRFNFHILDDVDPDDVFIKMNSRGKLLNEFEYFKADFLRQLEKLSYPASGIDDIGLKFDTVWEPELWKYTKGMPSGDEEVLFRGGQLDSRQLSTYMMRFINLVFDIMICRDFNTKTPSRNGDPDRYDRNRLLQALTSSGKTLNRDALRYFLDTLDAWFGVGKGGGITSFFDKYFISGFRKSAEHPEKICTFSDRDHQLLKRSLLQYGTNSFKLDDYIWMNVVNEAKMMENDLSDAVFRSRFRVVRNLFYRMDRGENQLFYILNATAKIMRTGAIVRELEIDDERTVKKFPESQIDEEKFKESLQGKASVLYSNIRFLEEWPYFRGQIKVLLPENTDDLDNDQRLFADRKDAFLRLFGGDWNSGYNALLRHALLLCTENLYAVLTRNQYWFGATSGEFSYQAGYFSRGEDNPALKNAFLKLLDDVHDIIGNTPSATIPEILQTIITANETKYPVSESRKDLRYYLVKYFEPMLNPYGDPDSSYPEWPEGMMSRQNDSDYDLICFYKHTLGGRFWDPYLAAILSECKNADVFAELVRYGADYRDRLYNLCLCRGIFIGCRKNGFEIKVNEADLPAITDLLKERVSEERTSSGVKLDGEEIRFHHLKFAVSQDENGIDLEDRVQAGKALVCLIRNKFAEMAPRPETTGEY